MASKIKQLAEEKYPFFKAIIRPEQKRDIAMELEKRSIYFICERIDFTSIKIIKNSTYWSLISVRAAIKERKVLNPNIEYFIIKETITKKLIK